MEIGEIKRPSKKLIEGFRDVHTATISDVFDLMGIDGTTRVINGFQRLQTGVRIVGPAFTSKSITGLWGTYTEADCPTGEYIDLMENGDVRVYSMSGRQIAAGLGDMAALALQLKGVVGAVVDGGIRDVDEIIKIGFPAFASHICATGVGRHKVIGVNVPVQISNVMVNPGDIIVADDTAVAVIPPDKAEEVLQRSLEIEEIEKEFRKYLQEGNTFLQAFTKFERM